MMPPSTRSKRPKPLSVVPEPVEEAPAPTTVEVSVERLADLEEAEVEAKAARDWARNKTFSAHWEQPGDRFLSSETDRTYGESLTDAMNKAAYDHEQARLAQ
jgi:pyocin large subunit-like protein